jgi:monoterpene epsilon-lactone hydrolase
LAPEHPYPAQFDDALAVYRWLIRDAGVFPERLFVVGDSAGGSVAVSVVAGGIAERLPTPGCIVANSPYSDMVAASPSLDDPRCNQTLLNRGIIEWLIASYLDGADVDPRNPRLSPLYRDLTGLCPRRLQSVTRAT